MKPPLEQEQNHPVLNQARCPTGSTGKLAPPPFASSYYLNPNSMPADKTAWHLHTDCPFRSRKQEQTKPRSRWEAASSIQSDTPEPFPSYRFDGTAGPHQGNGENSYCQFPRFYPRSAEAAPNRHSRQNILTKDDRFPS